MWYVQYMQTAEYVVKRTYVCVCVCIIHVLCTAYTCTLHIHWIFCNCSNWMYSEKKTIALIRTIFFFWSHFCISLYACVQLNEMWHIVEDGYCNNNNKINQRTILLNHCLFAVVLSVMQVARMHELVELDRRMKGWTLYMTWMKCNGHSKMCIHFGNMCHDECFWNQNGQSGGNADIECDSFPLKCKLTDRITLYCSFMTM